MVTLSPATIKAQQALSNKFGIPTFNTSGGISTVSLSGKINNKINVGQGSFKSQKSLSVDISKKFAENKVASKKQIQNAKPQTTINNNISSPSQKTISVPTVLSKATIKAQQNLSDKFGIPTFDIKGGVSTVPKDINNFSDINVGLGKYSNVDSLADAVISKYSIPTQPTSGGFISDVSNFFSSLFGSSPKDTTTGQSIQSGETGLSDQSSSTLPSDGGLFGGSGGLSGDLQSTTSEDKKGFLDNILADPKKTVLLGIVLIAGVLIATGGKKK